MATDAHISIIAHVVNAELQRNLGATEIANGFANRFLWFAVRRSKELPRGGNLDESKFDVLVTRVLHALDEARRPRELRFTAEADKIWAELYHVLSAERLGMAGAILGRSEAQVLRLSAVYAALDGSSGITPQNLRASLALFQYSEDSVKLLFGDRLGDPDADAILSALRSQPNGLTRTEISTLFNRNITADRIERALRVLLSSNKARFETVSTTGRPAERWTAIERAK